MDSKSMSMAKRIFGNVLMSEYDYDPFYGSSFAYFTPLEASFKKELSFFFNVVVFCNKIFEAFNGSDCR